jgi:hypothetical protein
MSKHCGIAVKAILGLLTLLPPAPVVADQCFRFISASPDAPVVVRPHKYDYVPSVMVRNGQYDMWWCGAIRTGLGDTILYDRLNEAQLKGGNSGSRSVNSVFSNSGDGSKFDGRHTCDPSVIKIGGRTYMYYGGLSATREKHDLSVVTRIGVAISDDDGMNWTRANNGEPILAPRAMKETDDRRYGIGQPSVIHRDGFFYLLYTNSLGPEGAGLYVVRSKHPLMSTRQNWTRDGFVETDKNTLVKSEKLMPGASADWAFIPGWNAFMIALRKKEGVMQLVFYDPTLTRHLGDVDVPIEWTEGPGLARDQEGNLVYTQNQDGSIAFHLFRSVGTPRNPPSWDIAATRITVGEWAINK